VCCYAKEETRLTISGVLRYFTEISPTLLDTMVCPDLNINNRYQACQANELAVGLRLTHYKWLPLSQLPVILPFDN